MKYSFFVLILAGTGLWMSSCKSTESAQDPKTEPVHKAPPVAEEAREAKSLLLDEEPLLLEDESLLLKDEPPLRAEESVEEVSDGYEADNSRCHVCHINYALEDIAVVHAKANIGCSRCHGESDAHIADESWASGGNGTAPDIMYTRPMINPFCLDCHTKEKLPMPEHEPVFSAGDQQKVCTDCHGKHRLSVRKCKWK